MSRTETIGQTDSGLLIVQHHDGMSSDPQRTRAKRRAKRKRTGR